MPFFKRNVRQPTARTKIRKTTKVVNEDVSSESEEEMGDPRKPAETESEDEKQLEETAQEKKVRLARKYLEEIEKQEKVKQDDEFVDDARVRERLRDDVLAQRGQLRRKIADSCLQPDPEDFRCLRNGHRLAVTAVVVSADCKFVFSASKEAVIVKWCFTSGKKLVTVGGHKNKKCGDFVVHEKCINTLAISSDDKFIASGCDGNLIIVWSAETMKVLKIFRGHRGAITGLSFRKGTHTLYSCSADRSVKVWNLDEMVYVETLFGHQDAITDIDSLLRERAVTSGGRDGSLRIWKIIEESQLIYSRNRGVIDCVRFLNEQCFVSGDDEGSLCLWDVGKKNPLYTVKKAHGEDVATSHWITSVGCLVNTDLVASGSKNGKICIWKCEGDKKLLKLFEIPMVGFINSLQFTENGEYLVAGVGQEHKRGRWWRIKEAKNHVVVIKLKKKD